MREYQSLAHTRWDCKYHVVFIPKYRKKVIYGDLRSHLGEIFHELAGYRECRIEEGNQPLVHFLDKAYKKGIKVAQDEMKKYSEKIYSSTTMPRWNFAILGGGPV